MKEIKKIIGLLIIMTLILFSGCNQEDNFEITINDNLCNMDNLSIEIKGDNFKTDKFGNRIPISKK